MVLSASVELYDTDPRLISDPLMGDSLSRAPRFGTARILVRTWRCIHYLLVTRVIEDPRMMKMEGITAWVGTRSIGLNVAATATVAINRHACHKLCTVGLFKLSNI